MPRGAAPGERRGGRQKGTKNKKTVAVLQALGVIAGGEQGAILDMSPDVTPLNFFLTLMRSPDHTLEVRFEAAKAAAPYVHSKLSAVEMSGKGEGGAITVQISAVDAAL